MMLALFLAMAACSPVRGPSVLGSDLAAADSRFAIAPAGAVAGYSPAPGSKRIFSEAEMDRLGKRFGVEGKSREVCFEFAMRKLDGAIVLAAIEREIPGADVELLEIANFDVPEGPLVFSRTALPKPPQSRPDDAVVWRGHIQYSEGRKFTTWAKVKIAVAGRRVVALKDLIAGQEISAGDVELRSGKFFPDAERWAEDTGGVIARKTLGPVRAGAPIRMAAVQAGGQMVTRGDAVMVAVDAGAAQLRIESRAESSGALGEIVKVRNPKSGKVFEARVTGKGAAVVRAADIGTKEKI